MYHWVTINKHFALLTTSYGDIFPFIQIFTSVVCCYWLMDDRYSNAYLYVVVKVISFSFITGRMIWKLCVTYFGHLNGWDCFLFAFMLDKHIQTNNIAWSFKTEELKGGKSNLLHDMRLSKWCWRKLESSGTRHYMNLFIHRYQRSEKITVSIFRVAQVGSATLNMESGSIMKFRHLCNNQHVLTCQNTGIFSNLLRKILGAKLFIIYQHMHK